MLLTWHITLSWVWLSAIPWIVARQASLSMGFSRQEHWSGLPFSSPGIFPTQGLNPGACTAGRFFTIWATGKSCWPGPHWKHHWPGRTACSLMHPYSFWSTCKSHRSCGVGGGRCPVPGVWGWGWWSRPVLGVGSCLAASLSVSSHSLPQECVQRDLGLGWERASVKVWHEDSSGGFGFLLDHLWHQMLAPVQLTWDFLLMQLGFLYSIMILLLY